MGKALSGELSVPVTGLVSFKSSTQFSGETFHIIKEKDIMKFCISKREREIINVREKVEELLNEG